MDLVEVIEETEGAGYGEMESANCRQEAGPKF